MVFHIKKLLRKFIFLWLSLLLIICVDWLSVEVTSWTWQLPSLPKHSIIVLIIADPQLIGYRNEPKWIGWLSRWDSDRYIGNCYAKIASIVNPSMELFLGDLLDEGVDMTAKEFEYTKFRFHQLFPLQKDVNRIYIPGDNDIGGEMEAIYPHLEQRFKKEFPDVLVNHSMSARFITVAKVNVYKNFELTYAQNASEDSAVNLLLSHVPLLQAFYLPAVKNSIESFGPAIILSAHDHTAKVYLLNDTRLQQFDLSNQPVRHPISLDNGEPKSHLVEFKSPTVSYRMGVAKMGYGVLTISFSDDFHSCVADYFVFWLPSRYYYLIFYAILISFSTLYSIFTLLYHPIFAYNLILHKFHCPSSHNC